MQVCRRCLYTSAHPLHLTFDSDSICSGCRVHEEKDQIDWGQRGSKLAQILGEFKNQSGNNYDCIVPVTGGKDSYFIVHVIKQVYGMNPLLVTYNKHYNTSVGIRNLANLRIKHNCDIITQTVNPNTVKKLTRGTLRRFGSLYWHCIAGQSVFPVQIAVKFKIPLIVWGAHQGIDQVGMFSHLDEVEMTRKYRKEHDLMGFEAEDLIDEFDEIKEDDVAPYLYPDNQEIEKVGVRGIYLNNFIRWDSRTQHENMILSYGYETALQNRTFDNYNDVDCWNYSDVHDYIKFVKHGYGVVVDHVCREIRLGRMLRDEAIKQVEKYIHRKPRNLKKFLNWMNITENSFNYIIDQHRNPKIWKRDDEWNWIRAPLPYDDPSDLLDCSRSPNFIVTDKKCSTDSNDNYILVGRGHN